MIDMSIEDAKNVLCSVYKSSREHIIPCLVGSPGIGKSQCVYELAKEKGVNVVEIIASQILPNEVSGITMPVDKTHSMEIYDHAKLSSLKDGDILFFDELLQAAPQTLSACLTLLQERKLLSGKKLPDVMIVAASNPLNSAEQVPLAIRQRFMFLQVSYRAVQWEKYMVSKGFDPNLVQACMKDIQSRSTNSDYNVVTPRTMEKILHWTESCKNDEDELDTVLLYIKCCLGQCLYSTLKGYYEHEGKKRKELEYEDLVVDQVVKFTDESEEHVREMLEKGGMSALIDWLKKNSDWDEFKDELSKINLIQL